MQSDSRGKVDILGSQSIGQCKKRSSYEHVCTSDMHAWTARYVEADGICEHLLRSVTNLSFKYYLKINIKLIVSNFIL
jgi:hypothetical protein